MRKFLLAVLGAALVGAAHAQKTEKELIEEEFHARFQLKDTKKADLLHKQILKKFPDGWTVRRAAFEGLMSSGGNYHKNSVELLKKWPMASSEKLDAFQEFIYYNTYRALAPDYFSGEFDQQEFISMVPDMDFKTLAEVYRSTCYPYHLKKAVKDSLIYPIAKAIIDEMPGKQKDGSYCDGGYQTKEQSDSVARHLLDASLGSYADIVLSLGQSEEALRLIGLITDARRYTTAEVNETHIKALVGTGQQSLISKVMKQCYEANAVTPAMLDMVRQDYVSRNGSEQGLEDYLGSLKSQSEIAALKDEIRSQFINLPYKPFKLKDMNGREVSSADWAGKVVVLDFWASWCFPCKNAFPGMQMAVDRFKDDPDVLFFFIDTMEHGDGYEQKARDYMAQNGFTFNVLFDAKADAKKPGNNQVVFQQMNEINHSMAIPRKMILKDGKVRLTQEGYGGSPSRLADEITYAVEMLKGE